MSHLNCYKMISLIHSKRTAFLGILFLSVMACSSDDDGDGGGNVIIPPLSIAELVENEPDYSSFNAALEVAGLKNSLSGSTGTFTVFVPTNAAFDQFLLDNGFSNLNEVPDEVLTQIIHYHLLSMQVKTSDLTAISEYKNTLALSPFGNDLHMYLNAADDVLINGNTKIKSADIEAGNGVIHEVDAVIALSEVATFLEADPDLETFVTALTREDEYDYLQLFQSHEDPAPFTVLAPVNEAFADVLEELEIETLGEVGANELRSILNYHIVLGENLYLIENEVLNTQSGEIFYNYDWDYSSFVDENGREANIIRGIQATNGFIYKLDTVLLPGQ